MTRGSKRPIAPYAGEKGNLRFPLDQPIPYDLIERIVKLRVKQNLAKATSRGGKRSPNATWSRQAPGSVVPAVIPSVSQDCGVAQRGGTPGPFGRRPHVKLAAANRNVSRRVAPLFLSALLSACARQDRASHPDRASPRWPSAASRRGHGRNRRCPVDAGLDSATGQPPESAAHRAACQRGRVSEDPVLI